MSLSGGNLSCKQCGCSEIDSDPTRGDSVCTSCGYVLEESIIVSEVTFEDNGHGGSNAVGQFVSVDMRGGGGLSGSPKGFHTGIGKESREITLRNAKNRITEVSVQLR
jgi:transcription factor IIIB subunit 2